ncbi:MAG: thioredoxin fold domain-containing protein [Chitinophagaceae bacterium]
MKVIDRMVIINRIFWFCLSIPTATAAQKTDFSGIWLLKERIIVSGVDYENGVAKLLKVNTKSDSIIIERLNIGSDGKDVSIIERMRLDGTPATILRSGNRKRVSSVRWSGNGKILIDSTTGYKADTDTAMDYSFIEYWNFSDSTKMLTVEITRRSAGGEKFSMKGVYEIKTQAQVTLETATGHGISFEKASDWENIKAKAKQQNKYIFVDAFATWCVPCKKMDREVFALNRVGEFLNTHFVSMKLQMDTTQKDNEQTRNEYATAHKFMQEYNITGFPTFLFFSPEGEIVHKALGYFGDNEFLALVSDALKPSRQYYSLVNKYRSGEKDYGVMDFLALKAREFRDKKLADSIAIDYKDNFLDKLSIEDLASPRYLNLILSFYPIYVNAESSKNGLFKVFYEHGANIDDAIKYKGFAAGYINAVITREEIETKLKASGAKPDWAKMENSIKVKYLGIDANLLTRRAQIKYYGKRNDWNNQVKYFERVVDKYGPFIFGDADEQGADNVIVDMLFFHCDDKRILNKAIGWMEEIIKVYRYPVAFVYGNYSAILYKAGKRKEAIDCLEKHLSAIGYKIGDDINKDPRFKPKLEILEKMKRGEKVDSTWDIEAFY